MNLFDGIVFHHVAARTGLEGAHGVIRLLVHRQDQNGHPRKFLRENPRQLDAVLVGKTDIDDDKVGSFLSHNDHGIGGVAGFAADDESIGGVNHSLEAAANQGVIINDDNAFTAKSFFGLFAGAVVASSFSASFGSLGHSGRGKEIYESEAVAHAQKNMRQ